MQVSEGLSTDIEVVFRMQLNKLMRAANSGTDTEDNAAPPCAGCCSPRHLGRAEHHTTIPRRANHGESGAHVRLCA